MAIAAIAADCGICQTIGAPAEIRYCDAHHRYFWGDQRLTSVSAVISACYPKKSWDGVDMAVIEHARERGIRVDRLLTEYVATGNVVVPAGEWSEVIDRFERAMSWWDRTVGYTLQGPIQTQKILYSQLDGVAGTADFVIGDTVIDLKNTAQLEKSYALQLGSYALYSGSRSCAVLHVTKDSCKLVSYDAAKCIEYWKSCVQWYRAMEELK